MPLIHPILTNDIKRLEAKFIHGYQPKAPLFYVLVCNEHGEERFVGDEKRASWGPHWIAVNFELEAKMAANPHLKFLSSRMFFIHDGNHQFKAWTCYINSLHRSD